MDYKKYIDHKMISCFYDSSEDCVKVIDTKNTLLSFNPKGLRVMEIDDEKDVLGKDWLSFWGESMQPKVAEALAAAKKGKTSHFEGYCPTYKGTMKYWKVSIAPLLDEFNEIAWLLVVSHDATREKELELRVAELESELSQLKSS